MIYEPPNACFIKKDAIWCYLVKTLLLLVRIRSSNLRSRTKMRNVVAMGWEEEKKKCVPKSPWQLNLINVALSFCLLYRTRTVKVLQYLFTFKRYITVCWSLEAFTRTVWRMHRLNSGIFRIFESSTWNLNPNSSDCRASKIISNDIKLEPIFWELNLKNQLFNFCVGIWVGDHPRTNFSHRPKDAQ